MASYKKKIRIALKKDLFADREYTMTVYRCAENAFAKALVSAVKFVGVTDKRSSKTSVTIRFLVAYKEPRARSGDIWKGTAGRTVNKPLDIDVINLSTCKVKRVTTKSGAGGRYIGSITISYSDDFFTDGRNRLMLTVAGSAGRIRGYRSLTVHKGLGVSEAYSLMGEDPGDDGGPMEFSEIEEEIPVERGVCYDLSSLEDETGIDYEELKGELEDRGAICVSNVCCMPPARDKTKECDDVCKLMAMKVLFSE